MKTFILEVLYLFWYVISLGSVRGIAEPQEYSKKLNSPKEKEESFSLEKYYEERKEIRRKQDLVWLSEFENLFRSLVNLDGLSFTEYMLKVSNGSWFEWYIINPDTDWTPPAEQPRALAVEKYKPFKSGHDWTVEYLTLVTSGTIEGVVDYVFDGTDPIGLPYLRDKLVPFSELRTSTQSTFDYSITRRAYKPVGTPETMPAPGPLGKWILIANYKEVFGDKKWQFEIDPPKITVGTIHANMITADTYYPGRPSFEDSVAKPNCLNEKYRSVRNPDLSSFGEYYFKARTKEIRNENY